MVILRALMFLVVALFLAFVFEDASAYPQYRDEVPNGLRSVDYDSVQVTALGHTNGHGGGDLNVFGKAFRSANYEWTNQLCMSDSDGDKPEPISEAELTKEIEDKCYKAFIDFDQDGNGGQVKSD